MSDFNVKRAYAEDEGPCAANHAASWEEERCIDVVLTMNGIEFPLCGAHARQLCEMIDEELAPTVQESQNG